MRNSSIGAKGRIVVAAVLLLTTHAVLGEGDGRDPALQLTNRAPSTPASLSAAKPSTIVGRMDFDRSIRTIYEKFSEVAQASGDDIRFEISGMTTYLPHQYDSLYWLDLFTGPVGATIETVPHERLAALPSANVMNYRSQWRHEDGAEWRAQDFVTVTPVLKLSTALEQLAEWDPSRMDLVVAASSYEVTVTFRERARDYRALILWKPLSYGSVLFTLVDHVVPGVDLAFHERRTVISRERFDAGAEPKDPTTHLKASCEAVTYAPQLGPPLTTGLMQIGHVSGGHLSLLTMGRRCDTTTFCDSRCEPYAPDRACSEYGGILNPLVWHKLANQVTQSSITGHNGDQGQCGYGWGCAVQACPLGACGGVSFGISGAGASLTIQATSQVLSSMSLNDGGFCPGAEEQENSCSALTGSTGFLPLDADTPRVELPAGNFRLRRLEASEVIHQGAPVSYLMAEWAVASFSTGGKAGGGVRILSTSSQAFARAQKTELVKTLRLETPRGDATPREHVGLIVALPPHEANSRLIPIPELQLVEDRVPAGSGSGKVMFRADFSEDHELRDLRFLYDTLGGITWDLAVRIENALSLEGLSDEEHRVVVFGVVSVGDSLKLEGVLPYLPKCCCGGELCI